MGEEGELLTVKCRDQLVSVERLELENHLFIMFIVKSGSGKNHQQILI